MAQYTNYILVCGGTGCRASQSEQIIENLRAAVEQYGLEDTQVIRTGCFGFCEKGPVVKMIPDNTFLRTSSTIGYGRDRTGAFGKRP